MLSGAPANGSFDLEFALCDASTGGVQTGPTLTNLDVSVKDGLFTVSLDFLNEQNYGLFSQQFWLQIGARTNGGTAFTPLSPRREILGVPCAFYAVVSGSASNAAAAATVAANGVGSGAIQNGAVTAANIATGQVVKSLNNLHDNVTLVAGANIGINANGQNITIAATGAAGGAGWALTGNAGTSPAVNFVGTTDNQNLELHVNGQRALLLQAAVPPNVIAGGSNNNSLTTANYGGNAIGGGNSNTIGSFNTYGFIGGGLGNSMTLDSYEAILGGKFNTNDGMGSAISGGALNDIESQADWALIGGGSNNVIEVPDDFYTPEGAVIGGGSENTDASAFAFVGGGERNSLGYYSDSSVIAGGQNNVIENYSGWSLIGGGSSNVINGSDVEGEFSPGAVYSVIAGGQNNSVASNAPGAFIGGGKNNSMLAFSEDSVISGGEFNTNFGGASVIAGGTGNYVENDEAVIGGGSDNSAKGQNSTVPGGEDNMAEGDWSFAAGVSAQAVGDNTFVWSGGIGGPLTVAGDHEFVIGGVESVGINNTNPAFTLDVNGTINANDELYVGFTPESAAAGITLTASGNISATGAISADGTITSDTGMTAYGNMSCYTLSVGQALFGPALSVDTQGDLVAGGNINANGMICGQMCQPCDRNLKENFAAIDNRDILERIINLPITQWDYKTDDESPHVGPMAQDFYAAFHLGKDDKHINTIDEGGVALAAVQGLNSKVEEVAKAKDLEINALKAANQSLEKRLADLEKVVERLAANLPR